MRLDPPTRPGGAAPACGHERPRLASGGGAGRGGGAAGGGGGHRLRRRRKGARGLAARRRRGGGGLGCAAGGGYGSAGAAVQGGGRSRARPGAGRRAALTAVCEQMLHLCPAAIRAVLQDGVGAVAGAGAVQKLFHVFNSLFGPKVLAPDEPLMALLWLVRDSALAPEAAAAAAALPPLAKARSLLRICDNPRCINRSGRSEAGLERRPYDIGSALSGAAVRWLCGPECLAAVKCASG